MISIKLGGMVFQIEEDAFNILEKYINSINRYFENDEGADEIVPDLEGRIAELLQEQLDKHKRKTILISDVEYAVNMVGQPEEFEMSYAEANPLFGSTMDSTEDISYSLSGTGQPQRRFYRNKEDKIIAGVCSGLSAYFGIADPLWMRLGFFLSLFFIGPVSFFAYIVLWIIAPYAKTPNQKLVMKGEPINIKNMEKISRRKLRLFSNF